MRYFHSASPFKKYEPSKKGVFGFLKKKRATRAQAVPTFSPQPRHFNKTTSSWRKRWVLIGFFALIVGWIALLLYLPYFQVNRITLEGLAIIKSEELSSAVRESISGSAAGSFFPHNNYFLIRTKKITDRLNSAFSLNKVTVTKVFPDEIHVVIEEKISSIILDTPNRAYLLDQNGVVIKEFAKIGESSEFVSATSTPSSTSIALSTSSTPASKTVTVAASSTTPSSSTSALPLYVPDIKSIKKEFGDYPIVYDVREPTLAAKGQAPLNASFIKGVIDIVGALKGEGKLKPRYFVIMSEPRAGVMVVTAQPWHIQMQPLADLSAQINNLKVVLKDNQPTQYIDLRFGNRIYWK